MACRRIGSLPKLTMGCRSFDELAKLRCAAEADNAPSKLRRPVEASIGERRGLWIREGGTIARRAGERREARGRRARGEAFPLRRSRQPGDGEEWEAEDR